MNWFRLKACAKCGGDLAVDDGDWICLQCGTYCYTGLYRRRWVGTPPQAGQGLGESEDQDQVKRPNIFGHHEKSGQKAAHLLGVS